MSRKGRKINGAKNANQSSVGYLLELKIELADDVGAVPRILFVA